MSASREIGGLYKTKEHRAYHNMKRRCRSKTSSDYEYYGEGGIVVCDRWLDSFLNFLEDMGKAPSRNHTLERIDVNGPYCKENCMWASWGQQSHNRRNQHARSANPGLPRGVTRNSKGRKYKVQISHNGKKYHLGYYTTAEEASAAYERAASGLYPKLYGKGA